MRALTQKLVAWGPAGVFLLAVLDSAGLPLPGGVDALLITVAALQPESAYLSAALAIVGSTAGSLFLYSLARRGGEFYLERHTASARAQRLRKWYGRYGLLTVFVPALVPIPMPMKVFVICAGALGVAAAPFTLVVLAARIPRYFVLARLGARLGTGAFDYLREQVWLLAGIAVALYFALWLILRVRSKTP